MGYTFQIKAGYDTSEFINLDGVDYSMSRLSDLARFAVKAVEQAEHDPRFGIEWETDHWLIQGINRDLIHLVSPGGAASVQRWHLMEPILPGDKSVKAMNKVSKNFRQVIHPDAEMVWRFETVVNYLWEGRIKCIFSDILQIKAPSAYRFTCSMPSYVHNPSVCKAAVLKLADDLSAAGY